jgi:quercetin dioxygenase-like cupin family protein
MPFYELKDVLGIPLVNGITIRAIYGQNVSVSFLEFAAYSTIPPHAHPNEQVGIVEEGALLYTIGDETKLCQAGSAFVIPPNVMHSATVVSDKPAKLIDVFTPPRNIQEPLKLTDR